MSNLHASAKGKLLAQVMQIVAVVYLVLLVQDTAFVMKILYMQRVPTQEGKPAISLTRRTGASKIQIAAILLHTV